MADDAAARARYGEAFWRAHHEAWKRSDLKSAGILRGAGPVAEGLRKLAREVQGRATAAGAQAALPARWRKSQPWSHRSHSLGHVSYPSFALPGGIVPPPRAGHRRRFSEADWRQILAEAAAAVAALLETAKLNGVEPHAYLKDVLERMANGHPNEPDRRPPSLEPASANRAGEEMLDPAMPAAGHAEEAPFRALATKGSAKLIVKSTPEWYLYLPRCCSSDTGSVRAVC